MRRNFKNIVEIMTNKVLSIKRSSIVMYWHHCLVGLFGYMLFKKL